MSSFSTERDNIRTSAITSRQARFTGLTIGTVLGTSDYQQMGRLYVLCPELGDPPDLDPTRFLELPPCTYVSPLAGSIGTNARGSDDYTSEGAIAYGFWSIPKIGSSVAVACVDGDPNQRIWIGCIYDQFQTNTLPNGRYVTNGSGTPDGPFTSTESPIQPTYSNYRQAFGGKDGNYEWRTRGADYQATALSADLSESANNPTADDHNLTKTYADGSSHTFTEGYATQRDQRQEKLPDSSTYSWSTPGQHAISMDDRPENCRARIKTAAGHQIILDDTNERIYINTAQGNNWIQIDQDGCIDVFSSEKVSVHAKHINMTSDESIRLYSKGDIHLRAENNIKMFAGNDIDVVATNDIRTSATNIHAVAATNIAESAGSTHSTIAGSQIVEQGGQIHMNGPAGIDPSRAQDAYFVNRLPEHEPWGRVGTASDTTTEPKYGYDDSQVGREHTARGRLWRR